MACADAAARAQQLANAAKSSRTALSAALSGISDTLLVGLLGNLLNDLANIIGGLSASDLTEIFPSIAEDFNKAAAQVSAVVNALGVIMSADAVFILVLAQIAAEQVQRDLAARALVLRQINAQIDILIYFVRAIADLGTFPSNQLLREVSGARGHLKIAETNLSAVEYRLETYDIWNRTGFEAAKDRVESAIVTLTADAGDEFLERFEENKERAKTGELETDPRLQTAYDMMSSLQGPLLMLPIWEGTWTAIQELIKLLPFDTIAINNAYKLISAGMISVDAATGQVEDPELRKIFENPNLQTLNTSIYGILLGIMNTEINWEGLRDNVNSRLQKVLLSIQKQIKSTRGEMDSFLEAPEVNAGFAGVNISTEKVKWSYILGQVRDIMSAVSSSTATTAGITEEIADLNAVIAYLIGLQFAIPARPDVDYTETTPLRAENVKLLVERAILNLPQAFLMSLTAEHSLIDLYDVKREITAALAQDHTISTSLNDINFLDNPDVQDAYNTYKSLNDNIEAAGLMELANTLTNADIGAVTNTISQGLATVIAPVKDLMLPILECLAVDPPASPAGPTTLQNQGAAYSAAAAKEDQATGKALHTLGTAEADRLEYLSDPANLNALGEPPEGFAGVGMVVV